MPLLSRWAIRLSLGYLVVGFGLGGLLLAAKELGGPADLLRLRALHPPFLLGGWLVQFSLGVAYWVFPRFGRRRPRAWLVVVGLLFLNLGIWVEGLGLLLYGRGPLPPLGRGLQTVAVLIILLHFVPRVWGLPVAEAWRRAPSSGR